MPSCICFCCLGLATAGAVEQFSGEEAGTKCPRNNREDGGLSKYLSTISSNGEWRDTARTKEYTTSKTLGDLQKNKSWWGVDQSLQALLQAWGYLRDRGKDFKVLDIF